MKPSVVFLLLIVVSVLTSCRTRKPESTVTEITSTVTPRLTNAHIDADSSMGSGRLAVDPGTGLIKLEEFSTVSSHRAGAPEAFVDTAGILHVKCPCLEADLPVIVYDTKTDQKTTITQKPVYINEPSRWQWVQIYTGRILFVIDLFLLMLLLIYRKYK